MKIEMYELLKGKVKHKDIISGVTSILSQRYTTQGVDLHPLEVSDIVATLKRECNPATSQKTNFALLKQMLMFQCGFYELGGEIDTDIKGKYLDIYGNHIGLYNTLTRDAGELFSRIEMPVRLNLSLPLCDSIKELAKATEILAGIYYKIVEEVICDSGEPGIMPLWTFHKDVIGNEAEWMVKLGKWAVSYCIYDDLYNKKKSKTEIIKELSHNVALFPNPEDGPNSTHKLDRYLHEACRLISSTQKGIFPVSP